WRRFLRSIALIASRIQKGEAFRPLSPSEGRGWVRGETSRHTLPSTSTKAPTDAGCPALAVDSTLTPHPASPQGERGRRGLRPRCWDVFRALVLVERSHVRGRPHPMRGHYFFEPLEARVLLSSAL